MHHAAKRFLSLNTASLAATLLITFGQFSADASPAAARSRDVIRQRIDATRDITELIRPGHSQVWAEFVLQPVRRVSLFSSVTKITMLYESARFTDRAILVVYRRNNDRKYEVRSLQLVDHPDKYFGEGGRYESMTSVPPTRDAL